MFTRFSGHTDSLTDGQNRMQNAAGTVLHCVSKTFPPLNSL